MPEKSCITSRLIPDSLVTAVSFAAQGKIAIAGTLTGKCFFFETEGLKYNTQLQIKESSNAKMEKITGIHSIASPFSYGNEKASGRHDADPLLMSTCACFAPLDHGVQQRLESAHLSFARQVHCSPIQRPREQHRPTESQHQVPSPTATAMWTDSFLAMMASMSSLARKIAKCIYGTMCLMTTNRLPLECMRHTMPWIQPAPWPRSTRRALHRKHARWTRNRCGTAFTLTTHSRQRKSKSR